MKDETGKVYYRMVSETEKLLKQVVFGVGVWHARNFKSSKSFYSHPGLLLHKIWLHSVRKSTNEASLEIFAV